jgi:hypothetical protein
MPTILFKNGWRVYFYANERDEPPHVHARKGDMECKLWLDASRFDIEEVYAYNLSPAGRREIRRIIFENFDYVVSEYRSLHEARES